MACSKVHLRLVKKFAGQPPVGAIDPSPAPDGAVKFIRQAPPPTIDRRHRPARSTGGGCGGGVAGCGGGDPSTCSPGMAEKRDVLVQAPAAKRVRIKTAAVALHPSGLRHVDIVMQSGVGSVWNRSKGDRKSVV